MDYNTKEPDKRDNKRNYVLNGRYFKNYQSAEEDKKGENVLKTRKWEDLEIFSTFNESLHFSKKKSRADVHLKKC